MIKSNRDIMELIHNIIINVNNMSDKEAESRLTELENKRQELRDQYTTNMAMIDKFVDNPAFEHLVQYSIDTSASSFDLGAIECAINILKERIANKKIILNDEEN